MLERLGALLSELKRRKLARVAVVYAGVSFVLWQVAELAFPALRLPGWSVTLVIVLTIVGFPIALLLAWAFELTPEDIGRMESRDPGPDLPDPSEGRPEPRSDRRRLAILPMANIHPDREQDYFADGMTEELISVASRIRGLDVIARTSVMAYRDTKKSVAEIGRELRAGAVLEGSVRKAGDKLRITVQLIDASTQGHLWSRDYDREMSDIFLVQSDIARQVAGALEVTLLKSEKRRVTRAPTDDLEAYDLYLLGRHHLARRSAPSLRKAIGHFQQAVELDPGFAPAHAGSADAHVLAGLGYAAIPEALEKAEEAARRALAADPDLPEAHTSLGFVALNRDWDWRTAERELARAIELNPSDARAHQWYAQVALYRQRYTESARRYQRALELDPLSVVIQNESGWPRMYLGDFQEAAAQFEKANAMDPSFAVAHFNLGNCHEAEDRLDQAIRCYRRAVELSRRSPMITSFLGRALARAGRLEEARTIREEIRSQLEAGTSFSTGLAMIHEALGEREEALDHLERALEQKEPLLGALDTEWLPMTSLKGDSRFDAVLSDVHQHLEVGSAGAIEART